MPALPAGITEDVIEKPEGHWAREGYVAMTPAIPLPVKKGEDSSTTVWVRLPKGKQIDVKDGPSGPILVWPEGAEADRVESLKRKPKSGEGDEASLWRPGDVRGSAMIANGDQMHRVYRPLNGWTGPMFGYRWKRSVLAHEDAVNEQLDARFRRGEGQLHAVQGKKLERRIALTKERGKCVDCHQLAKPVATKNQTVNRMTDASGWFQPMAVLSTTAPLERYRARMLAALHPHVSFTCPDGKAPDKNERKDGWLHLDCRENNVVTATLDIKAGLAAKDAHTLAVCASRQFLFNHMTPKAKAAFATAFAECGIDAAPASETP